VRLLAWNIRRHGGGWRLVGIMDAILRHDDDVLILHPVLLLDLPRQRSGAPA
jgi:hypothetical protein